MAQHTWGWETDPRRDGPAEELRCFDCEAPKPVYKPVGWELRKREHSSDWRHLEWICPDCCEKEDEEP